MKFLSIKRILLLIVIIATVVFLSYCAVVFSNTSNELQESSKETVSLKLMLYLDRTEDNIFELQVATQRQLLDKNQNNIIKIAQAKSALQDCLLVLDSIKNYNGYLKAQIGVLDSICYQNLYVCSLLLQNNSPATSKQLNQLSDNLLKAFKNQNDKIEDYGRVVLQEYKNNHAYNSARLSKLFVLTFISGAIIILLFFIRLWKSISVQEAYEQQLTIFNTDLEKQVNIKTAELLDKNNRLELIYNTIKVHIVETDIDKKIKFVNIPREGYSIDTYINRSVDELINTAEKDAFNAVFQKTLDTKTSNTLDYFTKDLKTRFWTVFSPVIENGEVTAMLLAAHNITELYNKQEELTTQNNRLETIYNAVQVYIIELDLNMIIQFVSKTRIGITKDTIIGQSFVDFISISDQSTFEHAFNSVIQNKTQIGLQYSVGDGKIKYWGTLSPIINNDMVTSILVSVNDVTELFNKQDELIAQNSKLDAIYNNTAALICELTLEQQIVMLNKGNTVNHPENYIGKTLGEIFGTEYQEKITQTINKVISKKKPYNFEFNEKGKDGKTIYFAGVYAPIITDDKVSSILLTALNISDLKHKQKELDKFAQMFELSPSYKGIADMNLNFISANKSMRNVLEVYDEDITKYKVSDFRAEKGKAIIQNANKIILKKGSWVGENYYISKNGKEIAVLQGIILHRDEEGKAEYLSTTAIDLTELKKKEKEALLFKHILDESLALFAITDLSSKLIYINKVAKNILGITEEEDTTTLYLDNFRPEKGAEKMKEIRAELIKSGKYIGETYYQSRTGKIITAFTVLFLHRNDNNEPEYIMGTCLDITDQKEASEKIKNLNLELNKLANSLSTAREDERTEIAREIHDELGQHLTLLKMNAYWLKNHLHTEDNNITFKIQQLVDAAQNTIDTNRRLLNTLHPSMLEEIGLYASLDWHIKAFTKSTGIHTNLNVTKNLNFEKKVNLCVYRIIQECLTNVIRYAQASIVDITLDLNNNTLSITVTDNGTGFDTTLIDTMNSHGLKGMRERVIALEGLVSIKSSPGNGVSVNATIPNVFLEKVN